MKNRKNLLLYLCCGIFALAVIALLVVWLATRQPVSGETAVPAAMTGDPDVRIVYRDVDRMVEIEKEITAEIVQDGLNDMGVLITQEYYFTEVIGFSSVKQLFGLDLKFTESNYLVSYEGSITAGIDFASIQVTKDDDAMLITVLLPRASIQAVDVDPNSFVLYSEKDGLGNPISVTDFNRSLIELENNATDKAIEKGLLENADANAQSLIRNFIGSMVDTSTYRVEFVYE